MIKTNLHRTQLDSTQYTFLKNKQLATSREYTEEMSQFQLNF